MPMYRVCSGQRRSPNGPDWGICLADDKYNFCPWWRAETANGRVLNYRTREQAERKRLQLEREPMPGRLRAELERAARHRAADPAKIRIVPYSSYNVTGCMGCFIDGKSPLRPEYRNT